MDVATPIRSVIPGVAGLILQVLARTEQPLTGARIAELTDGRASPAGVNKALKALVVSGVVGCRQAGAANLYWLNRRHIAADAVMQLSNMRAAVLMRIAESVGSWSVPPEAVWLFGSAARSDGAVDSDIDLLIVRPDKVHADDSEWNRQTADLAESVQAWTGNRCEVLEQTCRDLGALARHDDRLLVELRRDAITIHGPSVTELMGRQR